MNTDNYNSIVQVSCLLSMMGASVVALNSIYPLENRKKHGRILLLWLSICDFMSSLIYFVQTFSESVPGLGAYCQTTALLGIFFPVASFLWTDLIAYYLYCVVVQRKYYNVDQWNRLLNLFHVGVWTTCSAIVFFVGIYHHAGRADDDAENNTGGWCWVIADSRTDQFIWELIGGKFVEWISCLFILPYFYASAVWKLQKLDSDLKRSKKPILFSSNEQNVEAISNQAASVNTGCSFKTASSSNLESLADPNTGLGGKNGNLDSAYDNDLSISAIASNQVNKQFKHSNNNNNGGGGDDCEQAVFFPDSSAYTSFAGGNVTRPVRYEDDCFSNLDASGRYSPLLVPNGVSEDEQCVSSECTVRPTITPNQPIFSSFYIRMAIVPVLLFFIRFWSSIRVIFLFANNGIKSGVAGTFLQAMQAIMDPSQGFFNALIFVFFSVGGRKQCLLGLATLLQQNFYFIKCCLSCSGCLWEYAHSMDQSHGQSTTRYPGSFGSQAVANLQYAQQRDQLEADSKDHQGLLASDRRQDNLSDYMADNYDNLSFCSAKTDDDS